MTDYLKEGGHFYNRKVKVLYPFSSNLPKWRLLHHLVMQWIDVSEGELTIANLDHGVPSQALLINAMSIGPTTNVHACARDFGY